MRKIYITERQMAVIAKYINETNIHDRIVSTILDDLNLNYEPALGVKEIGNEFYNEPMVSKKVNGEVIKVKDLYRYMLHKHQCKAPILKRTILDWLFGTIKDDGTLSKNVGYME